jgi:ABC-2 type transport system ATP-binding protein
MRLERIGNREVLPGDPAQFVVETSLLTKRYGASNAVEALDLTVRRGEVYGLLGPNGAGKTTILKMLLGFIKPTSGAVRVLGHGPGDPSGVKGVGALVESPTFYPYLSGRDNLRVLGRYSCVPRPRVDEVLDTVDLLGRAKDKFRTYSFGMKQRLGVAAALLKDPELLVLDEPTNGLDPKGMTEMNALIRKLCQGGRTVLFSSHLLNDVERTCDRVGVIRQGKLVAEGTVEELCGTPGLLVHAEPAEGARRVALTLSGIRSAERKHGGLYLATEPSNAGKVNRALVNAGVTVTELRPVKRSLEEVFFELTRDGA